jgi:hypothetical protein
VVEDHLGFALVLALGELPEGDEVLGVQPCVGIPFKAAGGPRQVDQESIENLTGKGSGGTITIWRSPELVQWRLIAGGRYASTFEGIVMVGRQGDCLMPSSTDSGSVPRSTPARYSSRQA